MKTLSNNRGVSLVILIVAMTLIGVLGASFVSLMGSKQKGFLYQIDSYRALNAANAGVEYAIRFISDNLRDANNVYFQNVNNFQNSAAPVTLNMSTGESFSFFYTFNTDILSATGTSANLTATRRVNLRNFRHYMDSLTLQYDPAVPLANRQPSYGAGSVYVPIFNNNNLGISISGIDVTIPFSGRYLQRIYFLESGTEQLVYDYVSDTNFPACGWSTPPPCRDTFGSDVGIRLPAGTTQFLFNMNTPHVVPNSTPSRCRILFESNVFAGYQYSILIRYRIGTETAEKTSLLMFGL